MLSSLEHERQARSDGRMEGIMDVMQISLEALYDALPDDDRRLQAAFDALAEAFERLNMQFRRAMADKGSYDDE